MTEKMQEMQPHLLPGLVKQVVTITGDSMSGWTDVSGSGPQGWGGRAEARGWG